MPITAKMCVRGVSVCSLAAVLLLVLKQSDCSCIHGDVRLTGGLGDYEGNVQVCINGEWGYVCDNSWDSNDAKVVCRQLGYSTIGNKRKTSSYYGYGSGIKWMDYVYCDGSEEKLLNCSTKYTIGYTPNCDHQEIAGVVCPFGGSGCTNGDIRLTNSDEGRSEGRVEVCSNNEWGTVCGNGWDSNDATIACKQLGYIGYITYSTNSYYGSGLGSIWLTDLACNNSHTSLFDCPHSTDITGCTHSNDAGVRCYSIDYSSCTHGDVKLWSAYESTPDNEGIPLVCDGGTWYPIYEFSPCYSFELACKAAGYSRLEFYRYDGSEYYGYNYRNHYDFSCSNSGTHNTLFDCPSRSYGYSYAWKYSIGVGCYTVNPASKVYAGQLVGHCSVEGSVRLVGGETANEGRAEYCYDNEWVPMCADISGYTADLICKELGYNSTGGSEVFDDNRFGQSIVKSKLDYLSCYSSFTSLSQCGVHKKVQCGVPQQCSVHYGMRCYGNKLCSDNCSLSNNATTTSTISLSTTMMQTDATIPTTSPSVTLVDATIPTITTSPSVTSVGQTDMTTPTISPSVTPNGQTDATTPTISPSVTPDGQTDAITTPTISPSVTPDGQTDVTTPTISPSVTPNGLTDATTPTISPSVTPNGQTDATTPTISPSVTPDGLTDATTPTISPSVMPDVTTAPPATSQSCPSPSVPCTSGGSVRLTQNGEDSNEVGMVEYCNGTYWTPLCGIDNRAATVICRQLGHTSYSWGSLLWYGGNQAATSLVQNITCNSDEGTVSDCTIIQPYNGCMDCSGHTLVGLRCYDANTLCDDGSVRLVNGPRVSEGRVEVCVNGVWGSVCDSDWDTIDGLIVCLQLGYPRQEPTVFYNSHYGDGSFPVVYSNVNCKGWEDSISDCVKDDYLSYTCYPGHTAGLRCTGDIIQDPTDFADTVPTNASNILTLEREDSGLDSNSLIIVTAVLGSVLLLVIVAMLVLALLQILSYTRRQNSGSADLVMSNMNLTKSADTTSINLSCENSLLLDPPMDKDTICA